MQKVVVFYKIRARGEDIDSSSRFEEFHAEQVAVGERFLEIFEGGSKGRETHISLDEIFSWTKEDI